MAGVLAELRDICAEPVYHPSLDCLREASAAVMALLIEDHATLGRGSVGQSAGRAEMEALFREPPPEDGQGFNSVLREVHAKIIPYTVRTGHPRFLAFVPGAPTYASILGDWLCAGLNTFAGVWKEAAAATQIEILVLDWFKELLGYPAEASGILTGGGSEANLTALVVAREKLSHADRQRAVLFASDQRHSSVDRALMVMGFRSEQLCTLPTDAEQRCTPAALCRALLDSKRANLLPWAVVANAGTTSTGSIDPLEELADVCQQHGLWLHVDGAYGWSAVLTPEGKALLRGIGRADSITLDPHKWFGQTFEAGCVLVRQGQALLQTFRLRPDYMHDVAPDEGEVNFADHGIALTRRFRALKIWFSLKVLGVGWFRRLVQHCCRLAEYTQKLLEKAGTFEILSPRRLSVLCFRFVPPGKRAIDLDALNFAICARARATGRLFLATTRVKGCVALRLCFVNWRTTAADVEEVVKCLEEAGELCAGTIG